MSKRWDNINDIYSEWDWHHPDVIRGELLTGGVVEGKVYCDAWFNGEDEVPLHSIFVGDKEYGLSDFIWIEEIDE